MTPRLVFCLIALSVAACSHPDRVPGPTFDVNVILSDAARAKLKAVGESIVVIAYFDGDSWWKLFSHNDPMRAVYLGSKQVLIQDGEVAHFRDISFSGADFADLRHNRYYVTVNVNSARQAVSQGLLICSAVDEPAESVVGKAVQIKCTL